MMEGVEGLQVASQEVVAQPEEPNLLAGSLLVRTLAK
jgi:hypothetical protein